MLSRYIDWCGSFSWLSDWFVVHGGTSSTHAPQHYPTAFCVLPCVLHRAGPCNLPRILAPGGVRSAHVYVYVPPHPQKKVILNLFQLFDLSNVLITVLRKISIRVR